MGNVRVYQLAKELKVQSALVLELLDRLGREVKSDLTTLDQDTAELVRGSLTAAIELEKRRQEQELETRAAEPDTSVEPAAPESDDSVPATEFPAPVLEEAAAPPFEPAEPRPAAAAAAVRPAPEPVRRPLRPVAPRTESAAAATAAATAIAGTAVRKPRVFPARRVPPPSTLVRAKPTLAPPSSPAVGPRPGGPMPGRPAGPGTPGRGLPPPKRRRKKDKKDRELVALPTARPQKELPPPPEEITLTEAVTVKELAEKLNRKSKDVIAKLLGRGLMATINQPIDPQVAIEVAKEFGSQATIISFEEEAQQTATPVAAEDLDRPAREDSKNSRPRAPVVTVMGHVDHGKTSLLDAVRGTFVVDSEAGGITQHIGAYQVEAKGRAITFLDTPGHEAFTMMRARGAKATDIVVLVVAADDGVKPQTLEAIDHARAAGVPIVVAINKIDKPGANPMRVKQQLADHAVLVEEYGGEVVSCEVSAKKRTGLDELLDMILLVADLKELKADPDRPAAGVVLEARLDRARGVLVTVLVLEGTLRPGDSFIAGPAHGKVRAMSDDKGQRVEQAGPATPVEIMGFADEPGPGDAFQAVADEAKARQIASFRRDKLREKRGRASARRTLESFAEEVAAGGVKALSILLKADVQGSIEALQKTLSEIRSEKVKVSVLRASIGAITQADVLLAAASEAIVVGFNVRPDKTAVEAAKEEDVELRMYTVIYDLIDDVKKAMLGLLEPTFKEVVLGQAQVRQLFRVPKMGTVAGCYVTDGRIARSSEVRLLRDNVVIHTGKIGSLRRFKDDVSEVKLGYECGIGIASYNDLKDGDVIESFVMEKVMAESL